MPSRDLGVGVWCVSGSTQTNTRRQRLSLTTLIPLAHTSALIDPDCDIDHLLDQRYSVGFSTPQGRLKLHLRAGKWNSPLLAYPAPRPHAPS